MKRIHVALGVSDIEASVIEYTARLGHAPVVVVPNEYALWRTAEVNLIKDSSHMLSGNWPFWKRRPHWKIFEASPEIDLKPSKVVAKGNMQSASMINGACVFAGTKGTRSTWRLLITTEREVS